MMNNSQGASSFFSGLSTLLGRPHPLLHNLSDTTSSSWWLRVGVFAYPSLSARNPRSHHFSFSPIRNLQLRLGQLLESLEEARQEIDAFIERYNRGWLLERHGYRTPAQVRQELTLKAA